MKSFVSVLLVVVVIVAVADAGIGEQSRASVSSPSATAASHCGPVIGAGGAEADILRRRHVSCRLAKAVLRAYLASSPDTKGFVCSYPGIPTPGKCRRGKQLIVFIPQ